MKATPTPIRLQFSDMNKDILDQIKKQKKQKKKKQILEEEEEEEIK